MAIYDGDGEGSTDEGDGWVGDVESDVAGGQLGWERVRGEGGVGAGYDGESGRKAVVVTDKITVGHDEGVVDAVDVFFDLERDFPPNGFVAIL